MLFFNADAKIFLRKIKKTKILPTKSWKNHPQKLLRILQIHFFFLTALTAQTAQIEVFLFQNVVYWLTVYRSGREVGFFHNRWENFLKQNTLSALSNKNTQHRWSLFFFVTKPSIPNNYVGNKICCTTIRRQVRV